MFIQEILSNSVIGSVGDTSQYFAGRSYTLAELTTKFGVGNVDAYYTFPATNLLNDQSANAYNLTGTNVTDADNTTGIMNTNFAVDLDGTTEYMTQATLWDTMPTALAVPCWVKMTDGQPAAAGQLFSKSGSAANHIFRVTIDSDGSIQWVTGVGAAETILRASTIMPNGATGWYFLLFTMDVTNGKRIYVNGKLENQNTAATTLPTGGINSDMFIGRYSEGASIYFGGKIANMVFLDYVMTQADVDWLYGTALSLPAALQGKDFTSEAFMKPAVAGNSKQVYTGEIVRESDRIILSGGTRRATDYYRINGRF